MKRKDFLKTAIGLSLSACFTKMNDLKKFGEQLPSTATMPVLFLGHGSPMNAIEDNKFVKGFQNIALDLPKPTAILCISAHWFTNKTAVTAMELPKQIYDFGGFPKSLYEVKYPAKGSVELAKNTQAAIHSKTIELDQNWGLDHGAWTVIKHLYPNADVPIVQMSIDYNMSTEQHFALAKELQELRNKGILIIGSGNIIHNLGMVDFANMNKENYGYDWAIEAHALINQHINSGDFKSLINYQKLGKAVQLAIPSPDHYLPLIYTLGLKQEKESISLFNDELMAGSLSMTSLKIS